MLYFYVKENGRMIMCGIAGFASFQKDFTKEKEYNTTIVENMGKTIVHRGPDDFGTYVGEHVAFAHTRLAVMDVARGKQPMTIRKNGVEYTIVYNGEIYNTEEIRKKLREKKVTFETTSDTEVVLQAYIQFGENMAEMLNGIFSFAIWDERLKSVFLVRDRMGVKPLYYMCLDSTFLFASEIKAFFQYPKIEPKVSKYGLCQIFGIGPARVPGSGVYDGVYEILPGHCARFSNSGFQQWKYWELSAKGVDDTYEQAVEHIRYLLTDAIERQLCSDVPLCTLLSGGLDSSVVSAVAAKYMKERGEQLDTYSFDYVGNRENFVASNFQPEQDRPYIEEMVKVIGSNHTYLECTTKDVFEGLYDAVKAKDMPGMTDVDSSLLCFAGKVKEKHTVCLSGECADEIFGGYPWFRQPESFTVNKFPWSRDLAFRNFVLKREWQEELKLETFVKTQYDASLERMVLSPRERLVSQEDLFKESVERNVRRWDIMKERRQREIAHLNIAWFMETLLERKDRMTMAKGLEVRVPFADHRLVEYLYELPWEYKYHNQQVKSLLKDAMKGYLPRSVVERKKCPYPKTYDPTFENMLKEELKRILNQTEAPLNQFVDKKALWELMAKPANLGKPWFGQLMALPQMYAYLVQINFWLEIYGVKI